MKEFRYTLMALALALSMAASGVEDFTGAAAGSFPGRWGATDKNPPAGQYQPADGQEDYFWRLTFDFPLIDWNRRYRGVQAARMKKAQAFHELSRKRTDYSNTWLQCEQRVALAETNRRLAKVHFETAEMRYKEARISFETGLGDMPAMSSAHEAMVQSRIKLIEAELELKLANLEWMYVANLLQERFLGLPATEIEK